MTSPPVATATALSASTPVREAARRALAKRLDAIDDGVRRLRHAWADDAVQPGHIHQLRVAVRRASASLSAFSPYFADEKLARKSRRKLRDLRRAVGEARTADVGIALLSHDREALADDRARVLNRAIRTLKRRRSRSLKSVSSLLERFSPKKMGRWQERVEQALPDASPRSPGCFALSFGEAAALAVRESLDLMMAASESPLESSQELHELRLAGKRLRYTLEVFSPCFAARELDAASDALVDVQDRLGAINDLFEIVTLVEGLPRDEDEDAGDAAAASVRAMYAQRLSTSMREFVSWWRALGASLVRGSVSVLVDPRSTAASVGLADRGDTICEPRTPRAASKEASRS